MAKTKTIQDYKNDYAAASKITDPAKRKAAQDAAHQGAESIRAQYGYSGGVDGSQRIPISTNSPLAPQNAGSSKGKSGGSTSGGGTQSVDIAGIIQQMQQNSQAWGGADLANRKTIEASNQQLGASIGANYDPVTGKWSKDGKDLYSGQPVVQQQQPGQVSSASVKPIRNTSVYVPYQYQDPFGNEMIGYTIENGYIGSDNKTYLADGSRVPDQAIVEGAGGKNWIMQGETGVEYTGQLPGLTGASGQTNQQFLDYQQMLNNLGLLEYPEEEFAPPTIKTMTHEEALAAARQLLEPQYQQSITKTNQQMAELAAKRGVFDSPMSVGLTGDALADLESEFNQQLNALAQNLMDKDIAQAQTTLENAMQIWQMNQASRQNAYNAKFQQAQTALTGMSGLLNSLMQSDQNYTSNFGITPGGQQTLAGRAADIDIASTLAALTGKVNGLEGYGIANGTPIYNPSSSGGGGMSAAMAKFLAEQEEADGAAEEEAAFQQSVNTLVKKYSMLPGEAQVAASFLMDASLYGITNANDVYRYWISERPAFKATGVDLDAVERAILKEVGYVAPSSNTPKNNSSGNGIQYTNPWMYIH